MRVVIMFGPPKCTLGERHMEMLQVAERTLGCVRGWLGAEQSRAECASCAQLRHAASQCSATQYIAYMMHMLGLISCLQQSSRMISATWHMQLGFIACHW